MRKRIFVILSVLAMSLVPLTAVNGANGDSGGIVPCGSGGDKSDACTICHLAVGIDKIVERLMSWIAIVAVVVITVAGIMYIVSAGNQGMVTMAKTAIKNSLIGVAIALSAFVMIHFILKAIAVNNTGTLSGAQESQNAWTFSCN